MLTIARTTVISLGVSGLWLAGHGLAAQQKPESPAIPRAGGPNAPAPAGAGLIAGTVVTAGSSQPARRARVTLSSTGGTAPLGRSVMTDDRGRFSFADLPAGQFSLSVSKPGYLDATYGQKRPGSGGAGTPIQLTAGQHLDRLNLQIPRGGVITGVILDDQGEPSFGTTVRAMRYVMRTGERVLQSAGSAQTDDRGVYRIPVLPAGEYVIAATPRDQAMSGVEAAKMMAEKQAAVLASSAAPNLAQAMDDLKSVVSAMARTADAEADQAAGYAPVYYPGTTTGANAASVMVAIAEEKTNVDIQLQLVPMSRITGVVTGAEPTALPQIMLIDGSQALSGSGVRRTSAGPDGKFSFAGVAPGTYTIVAQVATFSSLGRGAMPIPGPNTPMASEFAAAAAKLAMTAQATNQLWAMADVVADGRSTPQVTLNLQPGMSVSGKLAFEGAAPPADLSRVRVSLSPSGQGAAAEIGGGTRPVAVEPDGRFTLAGIVPGRYRLTMALAPPGFSLKSSIVGSQDTLDLPFEVRANENVAGAVMTLTTQSTALTGALQDASGQPTPDYTVVVFPSDSRYWMPQSRRIQATRPASDGRFSFGGLPAGDYRMAAVSEVEQGQWFDPAFLRQLVGASIPVSLGDGERKTQDLRLAR